METSFKNFEYDDFVFENKNKGFGAYELRDSYYKRLAILAGIICVVYIVGSLLLSFLINRPAEVVKKPKKKKVEEQIVDIALDAKKPEPPPIKVEPPKVKMIKFVPPKIVKDKEVIKEEIQPKQEDMKETNPGNTTQDGEDGDLPPPSGDGKDPLGEENNEILEIVDEEPEFVGDFGAYLGKHIIYPKKAERMGVEGIVYLSFVVEKDGSISAAKVIKGMQASAECNEEALRVVKSMPKWKPGKAQGKVVRTIVKVPIRFELPEDE